MKERHIQRIAINGCALFLERRGEGPPLYVLHGGPGLDHHTMFPGVERLEGCFEVHYLDLRGHGGSDRCAPELYSLEQLSEDIEAVRRSLCHDRITLLGHSMGATLAMLYALHHPRSLEALILVDGSPRPPRYASAFLRAPGRLLARLWLVGWAGWNGLRQALGLPWNLDHAFQAYWAHCWPLYARRRDPRCELRDLILDSLQPPLCSVPYLLMELSLLDLSRVVDQIRTRTLILCGEDDVIYRADQRLLMRIPGSVFRAIPAAGHFPHFEQPERFAWEVASFLQGTVRAYPALVETALPRVALASY